MFINIPNSVRPRSFSAVGRVKLTKHPERRFIAWEQIPWVDRALLLSRATKYWVEDIKP